MLPKEYILRARPKSPAGPQTMLRATFPGTCIQEQIRPPSLHIGQPTPPPSRQPTQSSAKPLRISKIDKNTADLFTEHGSKDLEKTDKYKIGSRSFNPYNTLLLAIEMKTVTVIWVLLHRISDVKRLWERKSRVLGIQLNRSNIQPIPESLQPTFPRRLCISSGL